MESFIEWLDSVVEHKVIKVGNRWPDLRPFGYRLGVNQNLCPALLRSAPRLCVRSAWQAERPVGEEESAGLPPQVELLRRQGDAQPHAQQRFQLR